MSRFYCDMPSEALQQLLHNQTPFVLPDSIYHHWVRVLRATVGDSARIFNGMAGEYCVQLVQVNKKEASAVVVSFDPNNHTNALAVHIGLVMSKGDRMDYALQKATELGVSSIHLLESERCEARIKYQRDSKKIEHWQGVLVAACEQCGLNLVPQLHPPLELADWLNQVSPLLDNPQIKATVLTPTTTNQQPEALASIKTLSELYLLIGPEGGLSTTEIAAAQAHHFAPWQIGNRVLRTETAPVVALSYLLALQDA